MANFEPEPIHVSFDFSTREITVSAFKLGETNRSFVKKTIPQNLETSIEYVEIPLNPLINNTLPPNSKWVFSWKKLNNSEEFLTLEQYIPFPLIPFTTYQPNKHSSWSTLQSSAYKKRTNTVNTHYNKLFRNNYHLTMYVKNSPANNSWNTNSS